MMIGKQKVIYIVVFVALFVVFSKGVSATCTVPGAGDWVINAGENCIVSTLTTVNGNITINGNLTVSGTTLTMAQPGNHVNNIYVNNGGILNITAVATVTSNDATRFYDINVNSGALLTIYSSTISRLGSNTGSPVGFGVSIQSKDFVIKDSSLSGKANGCVNLYSTSVTSGNITGTTISCGGDNGYAMRVSGGASGVNLSSNSFSSDTNRCIRFEDGGGTGFLFHKNTFSSCPLSSLILEVGSGSIIGENTFSSGDIGVTVGNIFANNSLSGITVAVGGISYNNTFSGITATVSGTSYNNRYTGGGTYTVSGTTYNSSISGSTSVAISDSSTIYNWTVVSTTPTAAYSMSLGSSVTFYNNTFNSNSKCGLRVDGTNNNIYQNTFSSNTICGINATGASNNIYNNYFSGNGINAWSNAQNNWNISVTAARNIMGGAYTGGNYWAGYSGSDTSGDGLGDTSTPYNSGSNIQIGGDYAPIVLSVFTGPNPKLVSPANGTTTSSATPSFTFNVTDINTATTTATLYINGTQRAQDATVVNNTITSLTSTALLNGIYTWWINATDGANEVQSEKRTLIVQLDTTPPLVSFSLPTPLNTTLSQTSITITISTNESVSSANLEWNGSNVSMSGSGTSWSITQSSLSDGNYSFKAYANDSAGNTGLSEERYVVIDAPPATVSNLGETSRGYNWIFWGWANPANSDFNHSEIWINGTFYSNTSNNFYNATDLSHNTGYEIQIRTVDNAGNINTTLAKDIAFTLLDNIAPQNITNLNESSVTSNSITWQWTNPIDSDFNHTEVYRNETFVTNTSLNSTTISSLAATTLYEIQLRPVDNLGNIGSWANDTANTTAGGGGGDGGGTSPGGGGGGGGSSSPTCKENEILQSGKCVTKPQNKTTASNRGTATVNVLPTETITETPEAETTGNPETSVAAASPTALLVLQRLKNPYFALLFAGILFASLTAYAVHSGKVKIPKLSAPKLSMPKISLPKIKLERKAQSTERKAKFEFPKISLPKFKAPEFSLPKFSMPKLPQFKIEKKLPPAAPQTRVIVKPNIFVKTPQIDYKKLARELKPTIESKKETRKEDFLLIPEKLSKIPEMPLDKTAIAAPPRTKPIPLNEHMKSLLSGIGETEDEIMRTILMHGGRTTMARIFHETGIPPTTLLRWIVSLENRGLIKSTRLGKLRRVELTDKFTKGA